MGSQPIMQIRNVSKSFSRGGETITVLKNLNLQVDEGEFLGIMGPSGSGKTTLLNLIAGLDRPDVGELWIGGSLVSKMSEAQLASWRTRSIGFIFQFYHLLPVLTAYENVELPLLLLPLSAAKRRQQVLNALDLVALTDRLHHRPGQLSGGQQQRVGIARAIVTDPTLIVADEPTGDLDARSAEDIMNLMVELQKGLSKTILLVTHDPRGGSRQRVVHLEKGQLVDAAMLEQLRRQELEHCAPHRRRARRRRCGHSETRMNLQAPGRVFEPGGSMDLPPGLEDSPWGLPSSCKDQACHGILQRADCRSGDAGVRGDFDHRARRRRRLRRPELSPVPADAQEPAAQLRPHNPHLQCDHVPGVPGHHDLDDPVLHGSHHARTEQGPQAHHQRALAGAEPAADDACQLSRSDPPAIPARAARHLWAGRLHALGVLRRLDGPQEAHAGEPGVLLYDEARAHRDHDGRSAKPRPGPDREDQRPAQTRGGPDRQREAPLDRPGIGVSQKRHRPRQAHEHQLQGHRPGGRDCRRLAGRALQPERNHAHGLFRRGIREIRARRGGSTSCRPNGWR